MTLALPAGIERPRPARLTAGLVLLALLAAAVWALVDLKINFATLADSAGNAIAFGKRMFPLDFPAIPELLALCGQTLAIMVCATVLSVLLSIPLALLAALNTTPNRATRGAARAVIVLARAAPDVVLAIVAFRVFGLGGLTGVLAMGLHSVGMVGKLYADAIEHIDPGPRAAIRATGAGKWQELTAGVLAQVLPSFVATALHRLDINLRVSVVLGFVGVDGIGYAIANAFERLDYHRGMALALVVLCLCVLIELISGTIRRALLGTARRTGTPRAIPGLARQPWTFARVRRAGYAVLTLAVILISVPGAGISLAQLGNGFGKLFGVLGEFLPPATAGMAGQLLGALLVTVQIALAGTLLGLVLAIPIGALAARTVAPTPRTARVFRAILVLVRGIPELVLAIVFVVVTGLGPVAGTLALGIGSVGLLGKLVADSLEELDEGPARAVRATGASRWQVFWAATVPCAIPALIAHVLYQLDVNIRSATLLGIVGAGGIGFYLLSAAQVLQFGVVTTIVLVMLAVVLAVEALAVWLRRVLS
ncbi:phosphonate ABC transporter, permease protein PhnE [Sciscionella sediminilitoris]|uniref:phosphonate ABC transporter, permease protein PhnE n=1 Tax=Sciscionella sediminilitoris TaxID=1445613 RepID=UPI0004DEE48B|nr:phosphonate ABC transporter, permease protein PhnE [Sciscionella sp. SE31]